MRRIHNKLLNNMPEQFISYNELKKYVSLMDVAAELGYKLDLRQGKKFPVMVKTDGRGNKLDSIVICNPGNNEQMGYFRHAGGKGNVIGFISENKNELAKYGNSVYRIMAHFAKMAPTKIAETEKWNNTNREPKPFSLDKYSIESLKGREYLVENILQPRKISLETAGVFSDNLIRVSHWQKGKKDDQQKWLAINLGFPYRIPGNNKIVGLELRGWNFKSKTEGSNSTDAVWAVDFSKGNPHEVRAVYFAESPYDLMAMYQLRKGEIDLAKSAFVATGGAFSKNQIVNAMNYYSHAKAFDCFDNDLPGKIYGIRMQMILEGRELAAIPNGNKYDFTIDNKTQFSINNDKVSLEEFRKHIKTRQPMGVYKAPKQYKDWNDVLLGKRIDGKTIIENGLARHNDDNYNKRMEAFRRSAR